MTSSSVDTVRLGDVDVTRIVEWYGPFRPNRELVPDAPPELWESWRDELVPEFWEPDTGLLRIAVQSWVLRGGGRTVVVDTGVGNDRDRPHSPAFDRLSTPFPERLAAAGVVPEEVDVVVNTHLHVDHVGWNTRDDGGTWVPTFPNATYLMPRADREFYDPETGAGRERADRRVFDDSIAPVLDRTTLWEDAHRIDAHLTLEPAPGHTPGSSVLWLESGGDRAVFVGDMLHSPIQLAAPDANSCFCLDPAQARATRRRVLARAAGTRTLLFPAHFAGAGAAEIRSDGDGFAVADWVGLDRLGPA